MPPVLSKGGAGSILSATEPASVWAPSPETNCEHTESKVRGMRQTLTVKSTQNDTEQVGRRPTSEHYCVYTAPYSRAGWYMFCHCLKASQNKTVA